MLNLLLPFLGSVIGAGASLLGGSQSASGAQRVAQINAASQAQQNAANAAAVAQANAMQSEQWWTSFHAGQRANAVARQDARNANAVALQQANVDRQIQRDFAQHGVQWRVQDARASGIHPLAALGMQGVSPSPITVGSQVAQPGSPPGAGSFSAAQGVAPQLSSNNFAGQGLANAGQDISRAMSAVASSTERNREVENAQTVLGLENLQLQNRLLSAQIARTRGASIGPGNPIPGGSRSISGQGDTREVVHVPLQATRGAAGNPSVEGGSIPDIGFSTTGGGSVAVVPGEKMAERQEDDIYSQTAWAIRNRLGPSMWLNYNPPQHIPLEAGKKWWFNPFLQQYEQVPRLTPDFRGFGHNIGARQ